MEEVMVRKGFSEKLISNLQTKVWVGARKIKIRREDGLKQRKENCVWSLKGKGNHKV